MNPVNSFIPPNNAPGDSLDNQQKSPVSQLTGGRRRSYPSKKRARHNRNSQKEQPKDDSDDIYLHRFDRNEAIMRAKSWDKVEMKNEMKFTPVQDSTDPTIEAAFYHETDLTVSCIIHGLFADAISEIEGLLKLGEEMPLFTATVGTPDVAAESPGEKMDFTVPSKKGFKWYQRNPV